ncbi:hypothetical protein F2Q68_00021486 [Brassica cretica]|uniref:Anaphase-promoting complex subunit 4 WD40 domain-containing protein n=1 Tax=Brassica cretica TaxID=69181 RepID=A0A8S9FXN7_BRACR|nr:hypothetical protein F2Q68_00021486 [Brassica cretica]
MRLSLHLAIRHGDQRGHKNWVLSIAWSPDGKHLVSGSKSGSEEMDPWYLVGTLVHLSSPCRRFVTSSKDGDARIWDVTLKKSLICLSGHTLAVTCVKWGGDGIIYTGSQDCTIKMWETTQGRLIRVRCIPFMPTIARDLMHITNVITVLYCVYFMFCFFCLLYGHGHWVNSPALSTEYVLRTGAFDHTGRQYPPNEEMKKGDSPERLVSGSDDFTMFLWEPSVSKQSKKRLTGHQQLVNHVYFSPDGKWVASASFDRSVRLWNGVTGQFVTAFRRHVGPVYQVSWSADSRLLLSGSKDSTLKIWEIRTKTLKQDLPGHADEFFAVDWSPDGEKVVSGGKERILKLWKG